MNPILAPLFLLISVLLCGCGGGGGGGSSSGGGSGGGAGSGTTTVTTFAAGAWLTGSRHIAFLGTDLYVANAGGSNVLKINSSSQHTVVLSGITSPFGISASNGSVYVTGTVSGSSKAYLVANSAATSNTPACNCYGVAFDGTQLSYVDQTSQVNNGVTQYPVYTYSNGALLHTSWVSAKPTGLVFYNTMLYVTRYEASTSGAIQKIDLSTNSVTNVAGSSLFNRPNAIAVNPSNGDFYVVNDGDGKVLKVSGTQVTVHLDSTHGLCAPGGVAVGSDGYLYVSNDSTCTGEGFITKATL